MSYSEKRKQVDLLQTKNRCSWSVEYRSKKEDQLQIPARLELLFQQYGREYPYNG